MRWPDNFNKWQGVALGCAVLFGGGSIYFARGLNTAVELPAIMAYAYVLVMVSSGVSSAVCFGIALSGVFSSPATRLMGSIFSPEDTIKRPPENLLFALRMRLRDRQWEAVDQQTRELLRAYGHRPELYHLRALMEGGRSGHHTAVTVEASHRLAPKAFEHYSALLRSDPPPTAIQTGIDA